MRGEHLNKDFIQLLYLRSLIGLTKLFTITKSFPSDS